MAYGVSTETPADSSFVAPVVGTEASPLIEDVEIVGFEMNDEETRMDISFKQANGGIVKHTEWEAKDSQYSTAEEDQDLTNRRIKHICTKFMPEEEFIIPAVDSFAAFCKAVIALAGNKYEGKKFRMLFVYNKKGYVTVPKFPNFIEPMETPLEKTTIQLSDYNRKLLIRPAAARPDAVGSEDGVGSPGGIPPTAAAAEGMPF